jgi:hypothetical protein
MAIARGTKGIRCSRPPFILRAGTTQSAASTSISSQFASRTSPERAAVNIANSSARLLTECSPRSCPTNVVTSENGIAPWCPLLSGFGAGSNLSRFSPLRRPRALANEITLSMRARMRDAVSCFFPQIGFKTARMSSVPTASIRTPGERFGIIFSAPRCVSQAETKLPPASVLFLI